MAGEGEVGDISAVECAVRGAKQEFVDMGLPEGEGDWACWNGARSLRFENGGQETGENWWFCSLCPLCRVGEPIVHGGVAMFVLRWASGEGRTGE